MKKPASPIPPVVPEKIKYEKCEVVLYHDTLQELLDAVNKKAGQTVDYKQVSIVRDSEHTWLWWNQIVPNSDYEMDMIEYEAALKSYNKRSMEYKDYLIWYHEQELKKLKG